MEQKLFQPTTSGVSQGSILSPLLANRYLHELDKFMEKYTALTPYQRARRRKQGKGNFLYARYADDFMALCNGTKEEAEAMKHELTTFLHAEPKLTLNEINDLIWHTKPRPDYGPNGRQARTKNYYYFYTRVDSHKCAFWALPIGPQWHYASSFFLVISPDWLRTWKGKAVEDDVIDRQPAIPQPDQLAGLMMQEFPARIRTNQIERR